MLFSSISKIRIAIILFILFFTTGCEEKKTEVSSQQYIDEAFSAIQKGDWHKASSTMNFILHDHSNFPYLHLLNGLVYEKLAENDPSFFGLAIVAYQKTLSIDPNNYHGSVSLARVYLQQHMYIKARDMYAKALLLQSNSGEALYGMASTSYALRDMAVAQNSILKSLKMFPNDPVVHRMAALIYAAINDKAKTDHHFWMYKTLTRKPHDVQYIAARIRDWEKIHKEYYQKLNLKRDIKQISTKEIDKKEVKKKKKLKSVLIEGVILKLNETGILSKGNNLLEQLNLDGTTKGMKFENKQSQIVITPPSFILSLEQLKYSLNILNRKEMTTDIVARPMLQVQLGKQGSFESGTENNIVDRDIGSRVIPTQVSLSVLASNIEEDSVELEIDFHINQLADKNHSSIPDSSIVTLSTAIKTHVVGKLGNTIILGGLFKKSHSTENKGVPGLGDIPGTNLVFNKKEAENNRQSVLILLTLKDPEAVEQDTKDWINGAEIKTENMYKLANKHHGLFDAPSTLMPILKHLKHLYTEYRRGDVIAMQWSNPERFESYVKELRGFFSY